jgi:hypothetical protein
VFKILVPPAKENTKKFLESEELSQKNGGDERGNNEKLGFA